MESTIEGFTDILQDKKFQDFFYFRSTTFGASGSSKTLGILPSTFCEVGIENLKDLKKLSPVPRRRTLGSRTRSSWHQNSGWRSEGKCDVEDVWDKSSMIGEEDQGKKVKAKGVGSPMNY